MSYARSTKRQYQPPISEFFGLASNGNAAIHVRHAAAASPPPSVQSSLMSVGMRVRKAVPEGYRNEALARKLGSTQGTVQSSGGTRTPSHQASTKPEHWPTSTELLPFCGVHKTGGLAAQEYYTNDDYPTSSQESAVSTSSYGSEDLTRNARKRSLQDDPDEDDGCENVADSFVMDSAFFDERLFGALEQSVAKQMVERPIARAATRRQAASPAVDDFGEALFLSPVTEMRL